MKKGIFSLALSVIVIAVLPSIGEAGQEGTSLQRADKIAYRLRLDIRALQQAQQQDRRSAIRQEINRRIKALNEAVGQEENGGMMQTVWSWVAGLWGGGSNVPAELKKYRKTMSKKWKQYQKQYEALSGLQNLSSETNRSLARWALTLTEELKGSNIQDRRQLAKEGARILEQRLGGGVQTREHWEKAIYNGLTILKNNSSLLRAVCGPASTPAQSQQEQ